MTYTKPEVGVLGDACSLIEICNKSNCSGDGSDLSDTPAYALDE
jgi:hypothetical protein